MKRAFPRPVALVVALLALVASGLAITTSTPAQAQVASHSSLPLLPRISASGDADGDTSGDATMYMRRLALTHDALRGAARKQAESSLSRPRLTNEKRTCSATLPICVHYSDTPYTSTGDAPNPRGPVTPAVVLSTLEHIYSTYKAAGYRMPESDGTMGGDSRTDIYLADVGSQGYYGYCAPEPRAGSNAHDTPAFCVLDNDFSPAQFGSRGTPISNLDVTAAHEFFHAVQFAYDATEDSWFMESTAVWVEDEVFNSINDNTQYLPFGPLGKPTLSLDKNTTFGVYGGWIFFRWVTEHRPQAQGGPGLPKLPTIIRSMWERAAATSGSDHYSLQAITGALKAAGLPLQRAFAQFAAANRNPAHTYSEGAANHYPLAKPTASHKVRTTGKHTTGTVQINHLAAATERFVPKGKKLKNKHTKLRLSLDMADKKLGPGAVVTVFLRNGTTKVKTIKLSKSGKGAVSVPFSTKTVKRVELTMTNASTRMTCWVGGLYSCEGQPKDMHQLEKFSVLAKR
ncbi:MXAN_6640 family putative metalloprotease [Nocardioides sp. Iso805N]|uniref:MXAN_6640 family putative metalloprotease n=1 Tax=Nocardioides sp. Iso805N TaxID=1283287 RepID=UPI00036C0CC8|nr:MXAN_6640 family putative metalloprotease [Nocardioides sp. Iso805N]